MNLSNNTDHFPGFLRKIKIAVCLCGHPGDWANSVNNITQFFEYRPIHPVFNVPVDFDFFIHTFAESYNDVADIINVYKPLLFEHHKYYSEQFGNKGEAELYSFERCMMLKQSYELTNNMQYDVVIKAGLDTKYNSTRFPLDRISTKCCYTSEIKVSPTEYNYFNFNDTIFYGDSPTMDLVADIYSMNRLKNTFIVEKDMNYTQHNSNGCLLYDHLVSVAINPVQRSSIDTIMELEL
jgi:hypothetical protein